MKLKRWRVWLSVIASLIILLVVVNLTASGPPGKKSTAQTAVTSLQKQDIAVQNEFTFALRSQALSQNQEIVGTHEKSLQLAKIAALSPEDQFAEIVATKQLQHAASYQAIPTESRKSGIERKFNMRC